MASRSKGGAPARSTAGRSRTRPASSAPPVRVEPERPALPSERKSLQLGELGVHHLDAYEAAKVAGRVREALVEQGESFVFETVFSDPIGDKLEFLKRTAALGSTVVLCFIGLDSPELSDERVAMRVVQGGHDVPTEKLVARYPRTMKSLRRAVRELPHVLVFDNSDLGRPFRKVAAFTNGTQLEVCEPTPRWLVS
jgi:predicted ABC-type ATPase